MAEPSETNGQVNRTREKNDPAAFSPKPALNGKKGSRLRGKDKQQGDLKQPIDKPGGDVTGGVGS